MQEEIKVTWSCAHCIYFNPMKIQKREDSKIGNCHANAPSASDQTSDRKIGVFPIVTSGMWCGQFAQPGEVS